MRTLGRILLVVFTLLVLVQAWALHVATGARTFTRYPDPELEASQSQPDPVAMLFYDPGVDERLPGIPPMDNSFGFGLLPAGPGKFLLSVSTIAVPTLALCGVGLLLSRRVGHSR
jgi:hypothetical protein